MPTYKTRNTHPEDIKYAMEVLEVHCGLELFSDDPQDTYFETTKKVPDKAKDLLVGRGIVLYLVEEP